MTIFLRLADLKRRIHKKRTLVADETRPGQGFDVIVIISKLTNPVFKK